MILFWAYLFSGSEENQELSARYSEYLSGAIMKYTRTYDVEFQTDDFLPQNTTTNQEFIEQLNKKDDSIVPELISYSREIEWENSSINWSFWTPNISSSNNTETSWMCNGWLIFDPCIVLWDPIKASGWMNFGSKKYN